jgi:hypothetical protein
MAGVVLDSITRNGQSEPFELQVARGQITGHSVVNIFGFQAAVGTTFIPVWENATTYAFPGSAGVMTLVSSSSSDTAVSILISGLDANYNPISEVVALNGTTGVNTVNSYLRINNLSTTVGNAVGTITAKNGGTTYGQINAGIGRMQNSWYTVPAGYNFYLTRSNVFTNTTYTGGSYNTYRVSTTNTSGVNSLILQRPFIGTFTIEREYPNSYAPQTDIQYQVNASAGTSAVGLSVEGVLIKIDGTL